MIEIYSKLVSKYPIVSIEDPFDQDDFAAYQKMTKKLGDKL
jgi:enolase